MLFLLASLRRMAPPAASGSSVPLRSTPGDSGSLRSAQIPAASGELRSTNPGSVSEVADDASLTADSVTSTNAKRTAKPKVTCLCGVAVFGNYYRQHINDCHRDVPDLSPYVLTGKNPWLRCSACGEIFCKPGPHFKQHPECSSADPRNSRASRPAFPATPPTPWNNGARSTSAPAGPRRPTPIRTIPTDLALFGNHRILHSTPTSAIPAATTVNTNTSATRNTLPDARNIAGSTFSPLANTAPVAHSGNASTATTATAATTTATTTTATTATT